MADQQNQVTEGKEGNEENEILQYFSNFTCNAFHILSENPELNPLQQKPVSTADPYYDRVYTYIKDDKPKSEYFYSTLFNVIQFWYACYKCTFEFPHKINLNINKPLQDESCDESRPDLPDLLDVIILKYRNENHFKDIVVSFIDHVIDPTLSNVK